MTKQRPYINNPIDELERLVEASRADPAALKRVAAELKHRATDRAHRLRGKVTAILDGYELPLVGSAGPPVPASRSSAPLLPGLPGLTYHPATMSRRPRRLRQRLAQGLCRGRPTRHVRWLRRLWPLHRRLWPSPSLLPPFWRNTRKRHRRPLRRRFSRPGSTPPLLTRQSDGNRCRHPNQNQ